jgi:hypothetical protein
VTKIGNEGLTSHPRISQRAITPCGGYLGPAADHLQPAAVVHHCHVRALLTAEERRQAMRGYWRKQWKSLIRDYSLLEMYRSIILKKFPGPINISQPLYSHSLDDLQDNMWKKERH